MAKEVSTQIALDCTIDACTQLADNALVCKQDPELADLSDAAIDLLADARTVAHDAYLSDHNPWEGSTPGDCPCVVTCGMLIVVDSRTKRQEDDPVRKEIRAVYDNKSCMRVCSLNVLNSGYLPDEEMDEVGSYKPRRFPSDSR